LPSENRKIYGPGITEEQANLISSYILQAQQAYKDDIFNNAIYIQDVIEKSNAFTGMWTVEIVDKDDNWEIAGDIRNDQWLMMMDYGNNNWTYRVWTPNC
jgi:hypothetical protein